MEQHLTEGTLMFKTQWRDYCLMVKDLPAYLAVASNTSGATPKDLFDDVVEELTKQYQEDKTRKEDAVKLRKLVFSDLLERAREKEEKEAKKRKCLADDFSHLLSSTKEITPLLEISQEYSGIGDENFSKEILEKHVMQLKEQAKEDRKRKEEKEPGPESDSEGRHRRHKRDHQNGSRRDGDREELEDGEFGNVGERRAFCFSKRGPKRITSIWFFCGEVHLLWPLAQTGSWKLVWDFFLYVL